VHSVEEKMLVAILEDGMTLKVKGQELELGPAQDFS
jgi:hypothetical protein